jgi:endonuclease YncB( thermonuclease family)
MTPTLLAVALALVLVPHVVDAATLRTSLPTGVPAPRLCLSTVQPGHHLHVSPAAYRRAPTAHRRRPYRQTVTPETIQVHDGDTFYVGADAYRLKGIDTPELGQPRADAARDRLRALLRSGSVTIVRRAEDVYGRVIADVYVGGRNVARALKAEGYAKPRMPGPRRVRRSMYRSLDILIDGLAGDGHR